MFLVTGGAGFFGQYLVEELVSKREQVRSLDVLPHELPSSNGRVEIIQADVCDREAVSRAVEGCEVVYHNAALVPLTRSGTQFWHVNVLGTRNVIELSFKHGVRKFIYISSSSVYGRPQGAPIDEGTPLNPLGPYGKSKAAAEALCQKFKERGMDVTVLRPRPILGPRRLGILEILFERVYHHKRFFIPGSGENRFQLVSVHDLLSACYLAATRPCRNEDFNIGAQEFGTLKEDLEALIAYAGTKSRLVSVPDVLLRWLLKLLDIVRLSPFVSWHYQTVSSDFWYSTDKLQRVLGWSARYSNRDALCETYDWYVANKPHMGSLAGSPHLRGVKKRLLGVILKLI